MSDDTGYLEAKRLHAEAERKLAEAAELNARADTKLRDGLYALGQARHTQATVAQMERSIAAREQKLKALGEPEFLAREQAADAKLKEVQEVMKDYNAAKHGAARALVEINEREKREQSAA
jgi:hypothetical protein